MDNNSESFPPLMVRTCDIREDGVFIHGYPQTEICGNLTYTKTLFLTCRARLPTTAETKVLDAVLNGMIGYGYWSVARAVASANPKPFPAFMATFLAGGDYTIFPQHGAEEIQRWLQLMRDHNLTLNETAQRIVAEYDASKRRMPGIGHPKFTRIDPRSQAVRDVAEKHGFISDITLLYEAVHRAYTERPSRQNLCINIDGRFACTLLELGFEPPETTIIAMLSLAPGVLADIMEQLKQKPSLQLMVGLPSEYVGEAERHLPEEYIRD